MLPSAHPDIIVTDLTRREIEMEQLMKRASEDLSGDNSMIVDVGVSVEEVLKDMNQARKDMGTGDTRASEARAAPTEYKPTPP